MDVELIRPRLWLQAFDISVGKPLPLNIHELQIEGFALITAIEPCPAISSGEGSVVTGRFVTRQVHRTVRLVVADSYGHTETIEGTAIHPFWSLDRYDWVPMGELLEGEHLSGRDGPVTVLSTTIANRPVPVYNIEVNGEHVYEVGELGLLVHNAVACQLHHSDPKFLGGAKNQPLTKMPTTAHQNLHSSLNKFLRRKVDAHGNHMAPTRGNSGADIRSNFTRNERLNALAEFYKLNQTDFFDAAFDFFVQHPHLL